MFVCMRSMARNLPSRDFNGTSLQPVSRYKVKPSNHSCSARGRCGVPCAGGLHQRVHDFEEAEAVEVSVPSHDLGNPVLAHQRRRMRIVHQVAT